jgi:spore coat polysaccharide biosynthesis predicted glycosyltransferase SpsG
MVDKGIVFERYADADIVIIDSYLAGIDFYAKIAEHFTCAVYIDDNMRLNYPSGVVLNGNIYASGLAYPRRRDIFYLLGPEYVPLRKEFWYVPEKAVRKRIKDMLITFGGFDELGMTESVLQILNEMCPEIRKHVVIGKSFKDIKQIQKHKKDNVTLVYGANAAQMREIMSRCDIAVSAGGQTLYELARSGIPSIAVAVAKNQRDNVTYLNKAGFVMQAGDWRNKAMAVKGVADAVSLLMDYDLRRRYSTAGRKLVDGKGCSRVVDFLLKMESGAWKRN